MGNQEKEPPNPSDAQPESPVFPSSQLADEVTAPSTVTQLAGSASIKHGQELLLVFFFSLEGDYEGLFLRPIKGNKPIIAKLETKYPVSLIMKLVLLQFRGFE